MGDDLIYLTPEEAVGENVADYRKLRSLSQRQLADRMRALGFAWHQKTVSQVESASRRSISVDELVGLSLALGVRVGDLLDPTQIPARQGLDGFQVGLAVDDWTFSPDISARLAWSEDRHPWQEAPDGPGGPGVGARQPFGRVADGGGEQEGGEG